MTNKWMKSIHTDGSECFLSPSNPKIGQKITIRLRLYSQNPLTKILLRIAPQGEEELIEMVPYYEDQTFIWYDTQTVVRNKNFNYRFQLISDNQVYWFNNMGVITTTPLDIQDFHVITDFNAPSWLEDRIFYQIFPDRFCSEISDKQMRPYEYLGRKPTIKKWHEKPGEYYQSFCLDFFGGDIKGILSKVEYLLELGINAIYLNPIFTAPSNHRYDVQDYFEIDSLFGSNEDFAKLVEELHIKGIKVIIDGVFNHSGMACNWFNKAGFYSTAGAYESLDSAYGDFYCFKEHPHRYDSWLGVDTLPKLNYGSDKLRNIMYRDENSVMKYWLNKPYNIDGWRIDAANMLGRDQENYMEIWKELRKEIKTNYPDSWLLGEHFFDPTPLLQGEALDSTMNYQGFTFPVRNWLTGINAKKQPQAFSTEELDQQLCRFRSAISWQIAINQYNLINSHDLPRLNYLNNSENIHKLAAVFTMTYLGIPAILYGEEIALIGKESSESVRMPMPWKETIDNSMLSFYKELIQLRKNSPALKKGSIKTLWVSGDIYSYARFCTDQKVIVILNRGSATQINLDLSYLNITERYKCRLWGRNKIVYTNDSGIVKLDMGDQEFRILVIDDCKR